MKYVIIGNSAAAAGCIEGIRQNDKKGEITLISSEKHHIYSRPLISYLLYGKTDREKMKYRGDKFYEENNVTAFLGKTAESIDPAAKIVYLADKKEIPYDKLLIATGSRPFVPPVDGIETVENKFTFMSLDDALSLEKVLSKDKKVLIMGAGLIGLKCAEGIFDRVKSITVCDIATRILPSILDEKAAQMTQRQLTEKGIEFILGSGVSSFSKNTATLSNGEKVDFDILVIASGVRPNTGLAAEAGGEVDRGILVDEHCETTIKDVYAAGDCTQGFDLCTGEKRILALLPNAYMQGETAGNCMSGKETSFKKGMAMNAIGFFGKHIISAGVYEGEEITFSDGENYKKLFVKDDRLYGYILLGDVKRAGIYTSLIREKTKLSSIDFELICEKPQLMAFSRVDIQRKLGENV